MCVGVIKTGFEVSPFNENPFVLITIFVPIVIPVDGWIETDPMINPSGVSEMVSLRIKFPPDNDTPPILTDV